MLVRAVALTALLLSLAAPSHAAGKSLVTPGLLPPPSGRLYCYVVNASTKKSLVVNIRIKTPSAAIVASTGSLSVLPGRTRSAVSSHLEARYCEVIVESGSAKDARVTLVAEDAAFFPRVAVTAPTK